MDKRKTELKKDLIRVFTLLGRPFSRREYTDVGIANSRTVERLFGSWTDALEFAGLDEKFTAAEESKRAYDPEKLVDADWRAQKETLKRKAEQRRVEEIRSQMQKVDFLKDMLEEAIAKAEPPIVEVHPIKVLKTRKGKGETPHVTLWFEFSDLQLGTLISSEAMGGLNRHNWPIWMAKLEIWKSLVIARIAAYAQDYVIDDVIIACLGDMVEGQDIFKGQVWQLDRHVVDQAIEGASDTAAAFIEIMLTFPELKFNILEVFGNHGRTQKKGEAPYSCSMDKVYQRMLELHIGNTRVRNCKYHHNEAWFYLIDIYGWNHLLLHGDQGMSGMWSNRFTVNGLEKAVARYNQMLQQQIHFVHAGHYHADSSLSFNMSYMLINGSFIGTSPFSAAQMVASGPPMQNLHVFDPRKGLWLSEKLYLTNDVVKIPIEPRMLKGKGA